MTGAIRRGALALVFLVATTSGTAIGVAAPRKSSGAKYAALRVPCPETGPDGTPLDRHLADTLAALATTVPWTRADQAPSTCHRSVHLVCGPDLDGDGEAEVLVQVRGWIAVDDAACETLKAGDDHWLATHTFLASRPASHVASGHLGAWRVVARVDAGLSADDPDPEAARRATFVRRVGGGPAIRLDWSSITSESGCRIAGYEVLELRAGALHRLEIGDTSRTCSLCDCSLQ